jgi:carboxypeptidase PM20D1
MKKILKLAAVALLLLLAVLVIRALMVRSRQVQAAPVTDVAVDAGFANGAAARLAGALRFETVSRVDTGPIDPAAFLALHRYLAESFPRAHAALTREVVARYSLLYTWPGTDPSLPPVLLLSHLDVVPVEPGTEGSWTQPPFAGRIAGGFVWGRGSLDDKVGVTAILEAVDALAGQGFRPARTVYLAFGHDEEVGGGQGANSLAAVLTQRGVHPRFILDEGGAVAVGMVPGLTRPVALVGTAEKGSLNVELTAASAGGHSSMPPRHTAIGEVAAAVHALEEHPMPARIAGATRASFEYLAPELPFGQRLILSNLWLFGPLVRLQIGADPAGNARIRTSTAATMIAGGVKENVLPLSARAVVNFRILPGDTVASVLDHVRKTVGPSVKVAQEGSHAIDPSPETDTATPEFALLQRTVAEALPGALTAPNLLSGGTDTRHYEQLTRNVYRFLPVRVTAEDLRRLHGTNERVGVEDYATAVRFYVRLVKNAAGR